MLPTCTCDSAGSFLVYWSTMYGELRTVQYRWCSLGGDFRPPDYLCPMKKERSKSVMVDDIVAVCNSAVMMTGG